MVGQMITDLLPLDFKINAVSKVSVPQALLNLHLHIKYKNTNVNYYYDCCDLLNRTKATFACNINNIHLIIRVNSSGSIDNIVYYTHTAKPPILHYLTTSSPLLIGCESIQFFTILADGTTSILETLVLDSDIDEVTDLTGTKLINLKG